MEKFIKNLLKGLQLCELFAIETGLDKYQVIPEQVYCEGRQLLSVTAAAT